MKIDTLNGWRAVEAVIRNGGMAGAAKELSVSRAAVAAQVRGLEARIGRALFHRRPSGLEPTSEALRVSPRLKAAFGEIAAVQQDLQSEADDRRLALTMSQFFADTWLPKHLPDLMREMPGLDLRIDSSPDVVNLETGEFDFGFRYMGDPVPPLTGIDLFPGAFAPVCTPEFADRYNLSEQTTTLRNVPLIHLPDLSTAPTPTEWPTWSARTGIPLDSDPAENVGYARMANGLGLARSGSSLVLGVLAACLDAVVKGEIVFPLGPRSVVFTEYRHQLVWLSDRRLTGTLKRFREFVAERADHDRQLADKLFGQNRS